MRHGRSFHYNQRPQNAIPSVYWQTSGVINVTEVADYTNFTAAGVKTITITLVDINNAALLNLSNLKWAWFDFATPNLFTAAPTDKGTTESTDGSGVCTIDLPNTALTSGQIGWLIITDSDGTTTQNPYHRAFSGPVAIN